MALGTGELMIAITPEAQWLSPVLVAATDHALKPVPLTPDELGEAIRRWTGRPLRRPLSAGDIAGLDLPDLAAALRPGMTAAACRRHLQQASRRRVGPPPSAHEIVPLAALTGLGEAHAWATDLVACIERVRAGRLPASALEGCVLFGRPGTGKTSLARSVAAAAGIPFIETSVGAWFSTSSGNLDGVVKAVDKFCDSLVLAAKAAGTGGLAIGFVDELDALPHRGRLSDRGADWWLPVVTHTLTRVESLRQRGIILIAVTNDLIASTRRSCDPAASTGASRCRRPTRPAGSRHSGIISGATCGAPI
jgi:hypothetical protein